MAKTPFTVTKGDRDGRVGIRCALRGSGAYSQADIQMQATTSLTTTEARELAAALIQQADAEDAKLLKKEQAEERRRKWHNREIAAGRMKVFSATVISSEDVDERGCGSLGSGAGMIERMQGSEPSLFPALPDDPVPLPPDDAALLARLPLYGVDQCIEQIAEEDEAICHRLERRGLVKLHRWKDDPIAVRPTMYAGRLP